MGYINLPPGSYVEFLTVDEIENLDQTKRYAKYKEMLKNLKNYPEIYKGPFRVVLSSKKGYRNIYSLVRNIQLEVPVWCLRNIWMPDWNEIWSELLDEVNV